MKHREKTEEVNFLKTLEKIIYVVKRYNKRKWFHFDVFFYEFWKKYGKNCDAVRG